MALTDLKVVLAAGEKEDKESLLFSALTKFMMKSALSSISEIERCVNPSLVSDHSTQIAGWSIRESGETHS